MSLLVGLSLSALLVSLLAVGWFVGGREGFAKSLFRWPPSWKHVLFVGVEVVLVLGVGIQLVPYGRAHSDPPILGEPVWDSPRTEELARQACFDCHSNETVWPWYSNVAPVSWLLTQHVAEGRGHLNFSEWGVGHRDRGDEAARTVRSGSMPPWDYLLAHPLARLSQAEQQELIDGLVATFGDRRR